MQYVVQTFEELGGEPQLKVFGARPTAEAHFRKQAAAIDAGEIEIVTLFQVDCHEVRDAVQAVKAGDKKRVGLLEQRRSMQALMSSEIRRAVAAWSLGDEELP